MDFKSLTKAQKRHWDEMTEGRRTHVSYAGDERKRLPAALVEKLSKGVDVTRMSIAKAAQKIDMRDPPPSEEFKHKSKEMEKTRRMRFEDYLPNIRSTSPQRQAVLQAGVCLRWTVVMLVLV